jgi:large subunit ribosomal protein L3
MAVKGILGRKLGMTQIWDADNRVVPVTVIQAGPCRVVQLKTPERDGYAAIQLAFGATKPQRLSKPELGHLAKADAGPSRDLAELRVDDLSPYQVGQEIGADVFAAGERVDVTGISKGKGFTGVMVRHNFKGQGASHGNHKSHRKPGAIGACATPARVFKGMKMAGQHGAQRTTTLNLEVVEGDAERGLLLIKGSVPGPSGGLVFVRNAVKGPDVAPPTFTTDAPATDATEDGGSGNAEQAVPQDADSDVSGEQVSDAEVSEVTT